MAAEVYPFVPEQPELTTAPERETELTDIYNLVDSTFKGILDGTLPKQVSKDTRWEQVDSTTIEIERDMLAQGRGRYSTQITRRSEAVYDVTLLSLTPQVQGLQGLRLDFGLNKFGFPMPGHSKVWLQDNPNSLGMLRTLENFSGHQPNAPIVWARELKDFLGNVLAPEPSVRQQTSGFIGKLLRRK